MAFTQRLVDTFFKKSGVNLSGVNQKIRASYGVAFYPEDSMSVDTLLKYASYAMFEVKSCSKGELLRFNKESYQQKTNLYEKQERLGSLVDEKLIRFAFQPIVDLEDGSLFGYEALMRSLTDDFSSPLEILRLAESQSKLNQIERVTFELLFDWLDHNVEHLNGAKIFFNTVSSRLLREPAIFGVHARAQELCQHVVFEILESTSEETEFANAISAFRERFSCLVAIDDYGCGYSNDMRLISLAPDIVKIDRFFIRDIHRNHDKQHLLGNILSFCASKGIAALAEGVETFEELRKVMDLGFRYVQGYYIAEPDFLLQTVDPNIIRAARKVG
jgi:EAL domain-containing protein (putative c-di-GMP-specific phosphodiesterase class I)